MVIFASFCGDLAACVCMAILAMRFFPATITGRQVDQNRWMIPVLPFIVVFDLVDMAGKLIGRTVQMTGHLFYKVTGKQPRSRRHSDSYFSYGYSAPAARKRSSARTQRSSKRQRRNRFRA